MKTENGVTTYTHGELRHEASLAIRNEAKRQKFGKVALISWSIRIGPNTTTLYVIGSCGGKTIDTTVAL